MTSLRKGHCGQFFGKNAGFYWLTGNILGKM